MLMTIRDKAQGWIAWVIVILISIPFALWGIQEYLGVGAEKVIVKVDDREITEREVEQAAFDLRNNLRQRLGQQYDADMFPESMLRERVLDSIIRDSLIQQATVDLGLRVGDAAVSQTILSVPAFQVAGQFNQEAYQRAVSLQGMTQAAFEERLRNSLTLQQLESVVQSSAFVTPQMVADYQQLNNQQRKVRYLTMTTANLDKPAMPSEEEIQAYYDKNQQAFMAPERVKLDYILLNLDTIASTLKASDDDLLAYYEEHKSEFIVADKKRISHILIELPEDADQAKTDEVIAKAETLYQQLQNGADFAELAQTHSADVVSAEAGGDLGILETGLFDKAFETAALALEENQVSQPVRTRFGYHLIKVTELQAGDADDFEAVKDQVKTAYLKTEAEQIFFDYAERLANIAYETPDSLVPASEELGLPIVTSDWITRQGGEGVLAEPKVIGAAFSEEAITQGYNSEALELSPTDLMILRVAEHEAEAVKPLDTIKDDVIAQLQNKAAFQALQSQVDTALESLQAGSATLNQLAEQNGIAVVDAGALTREANNAPFEIVSQVFRMTIPEEGKSSYQAVITGQDRIAIVELSDVINGDVSGSSDSAESLLASQQGSDQFEMFIESLKAKAAVEYLNSE